MPAERVSMRRVREILRLKHEAGASDRGDRPIGGRGPQHGAAVPGPGGSGGAGLAAALDADGRRAGGAAVRRRRGDGRAAAQGRARLGGGAPRTAAARRDADAALVRIPGGQPRRVPVQPLVRALPGLGGPAVADHAAGPPGRGAAVRRLRRADSGGGRPDHRRGPGGAGLRRGAGRLELHLCRGGLDANAAGLGGCPCPGVGVPGRRAAADRARQRSLIKS